MEPPETFSSLSPKDRATLAEISSKLHMIHLSAGVICVFQVIGVLVLMVSCSR